MNRRGFVARAVAGIGALALGRSWVGEARAAAPSAGAAVKAMPMWLVGIIDTEHPWGHLDGTSTTIRHAGVTGFDSAPLTDGFCDGSTVLAWPVHARAVALSVDGVAAKLGVYAPVSADAASAFEAGRVQVGGAFLLRRRDGDAITGARLYKIACHTTPDDTRKDVTYIVGVRAETPEDAIEAARPLLPAFRVAV